MAINDGYTKQALIKVEDYPTFTITYRPVLSSRSDEFMERRGKTRIDATMILWKGQVDSWDAPKEVFVSEPVSSGEAGILCIEENWRKLAYPVREKITDYVTGMSRQSQEGSEKN